VADALPAKLNPARKLWRGDSRTFTHVFRVGPTDDDAPLDLTGHTFIAQYRADKNRGEVVAEATCSIIDDGTVLEVLTSLEADKLPGEVEGEPVPVLYWDLQSTDAEGERHTWLYSDVHVRGDRSDG
jgi:hypothetical protein